MNNNPPFYIGQKVVCIRDDFKKGIYGEKMPKKGDVLTVRGFELGDHAWYLIFNEIINPLMQYMEGLGEALFNSNCFAPIEENRIRYVAVSETLRDKAVEIAAIETN